MYLFIEDDLLVLYKIFGEFAECYSTFEWFSFDIYFIQSTFTFSEPVVINLVQTGIRLRDFLVDALHRRRFWWISLRDNSNVYNKTNDDQNHRCQKPSKKAQHFLKHFGSCQ